jgi:acyl transferase domain-containing protein
MHSLPPEGIAIIGADACFAGGVELDELWQSSSARASAIREVPAERWQPARYVAPGEPGPRAVHGGFLPPAALVFPAQRYRLPPRQVERMHPMDRVLLRTILRAIEHAHAGGGRELPRASTAIVVGAMGPGLDPGDPRILGFRRHEVTAAVAAAPAVQALDASRRAAILARIDAALADDMQRGAAGSDVTGSASILAGRVSNMLDMGGMHLVVDAEAASALVALDVAVRGLRRGDFEAVVVAAVSPWLSPQIFDLYGRLGVLRGGGVRPCVEPGQGLVPGEGAGAVVLKRLGDAQRDGDRVLAVVHGVGMSGQGRERVLPAISAGAFARAMGDALDQAGWQASSVSYLECHAPGVPDWDRAENEAIERVYHRNGGRPLRASVQDVAGYALSAAGMCSLVRAVLALDRGSVPPARAPGETHAPAGWLPGPRRVGITAAGLHGLACHVLLEAAPASGAAAPQAAAPRATDLAIVGMGGVFPGAPDVPRFWDNIVNRVDTITDVPSERWDPEPFYDADPERPGRIYSRKGAFVRDFRAQGERHGLPPRRLERMDRSQGFALEAARQALADAGLDPAAQDRTRIGVVLADMDWRAGELEPALWLAFLGFREPLHALLVDHGLASEVAGAVIAAATEEFRRRHPPATEDTLPGVLGSCTAGNVAYAFDLQGPCFLVESVCASSLAALQAASLLLSGQRCDVVVSGGVFANMTPEYYLANCSFRALSPGGIRPFDAQADGFVPGEGAGLVVLERAGAPGREPGAVYALVRGIGGSSDGRGRSIVAPNENGQVLAVERALAQASVPPHTVGFVECHGAGTVLGDATEVGSYTRAYGERDTRLGLTSIKSMIGHLSSAAGAAGLLKAALAIRHGVLPPSLGFHTPNDRLAELQSRFEVITEARPWIPDIGPRRAAVSAFGLGGTNFHVVLEEPGARPAADTADQPVETVIPAAEGAITEMPRRGTWTQALSGAHELRDRSGVHEVSEAAMLSLLVDAAARLYPERPVLALERVQIFEPRPCAPGPRVELALAAEARAIGDQEALVAVRIERPGTSVRACAVAQARLGPPGKGNGARSPHLGDLDAAGLARVLAATGSATHGAAGEPQLLGLARLALAPAPAPLRWHRAGRELVVTATAAVPPCILLAEHARWLIPIDPMAVEPFGPGGEVRDRSLFPLLDRLLRSEGSRREIARDVSLESEPYLEDHCLDSVSVVPGAVHFETMVEAGLLCRPSGTPVAIENVDVPLAVRVLPGRGVRMRAVVEAAPARMAIRLVSDFVDAHERVLVTDRVHATGEVVFGDPLPPRRATPHAALLRWIARGGADFAPCYSDPRENTTVGPRLWALQWVRRFGQHELLACVRTAAQERLLRSAGAPRFRLDPFLLDGCFQAAGVLSTLCYRRMSLPAGARQLRIHREAEPHEPLYVHVVLTGLHGEDQTRCNIQVMDATGHLVWDIEDYRAYLTWPLPDREVGMERLVAGAHTPHALAQDMEPRP